MKFPEEAKLSGEAKDLICRLLCNVERRLGTKGAYEIKVGCFRLFFLLICCLHGPLFSISITETCLLMLGTSLV